MNVKIKLYLNLSNSNMQGEDKNNGRELSAKNWLLESYSSPGSILEYCFVLSFFQFGLLQIVEPGLLIANPFNPPPAHSRKK
jgi:hypothetical protein